MDTASCACARPRASPTARYNRRDAFYQRAKEEGYRSRAVYKLEDLLRRVPPLRAGARVVELGCWPGGWLQLLLERVGESGRVVGVDLAETDALPPAVLLQLDVTEPDTLDAIAEALGGPADLVLSDAAPKLSGIRDVDRGAQEELYAAALAVAERVLVEGGSLIVKGFPGPEADLFRKELRGRFPHVAEVRPEGKRGTSKEFYWVAGQEPRTRPRRKPKSKR